MVIGNSNTSVTWGVSGAGCSDAACGTISSGGLYTPPSSVPSPATVSVVATNVADTTKSASASVAAVTAVAVLLSISPTNTSVIAARMQSLTRSVTGIWNTAAIVTATSAADPSKADSVFLSIAPTTSTNAIDGLSIPATHPRLFWSSDRLAKARSWWGQHSYTPNYSNPNPFDPYDTLLACQMSNNQTWCNAQINWAVNLSEASCYQSVGCDSMRVYGEAVMLTYDWLYARMTATQRANIMNNWNTWQNYLDTSNSWGNTGMPSSNYFAGAFRTDFSMGVATLGDNTQATNFLNYALNNRWPAVVNFVSPTGNGALAGKGYAMPQQEGSQYGRYSLSYYAVSLVTSALMRRDLGQESLAFRAGALETIYNTMPTQTVSRGMYDGFTWSDDENWIAGAALYGGGGMQSRYYGDFMMAAAQEFPTTAIGKVTRQWINKVNPNVGAMWKAVDPGGSTQAFSTLPLDYYASGPHFAFWRSSWNTNASALFLQMGQTFGVGHTHFDVGNFQWFRSGAYLIRETPTYTTTVAGYNSLGTVDGSSGYAHNVPLIGGLPGVTAGCSDSNAVVRRMESQPSYAYIDTDIGGTYTNNVCAGNHPERENAYAKHVEREFIFFRDIEVLLVLDRLQSDTASRGKTFTSHCENRPRSIDALHYSCVDGNQQANYSVLLPATGALTVVNESSNSATCGQGVCQYRLEVNDNSPIGAQSYFLVAIQGLNAGGTALAPTVQDNGSSWTVTLNANHRATINKGLTSAGGSVTINGTTTNLRSDVQPMAITDNGPVW
jgi:hypothetical protein